MINYLIFQMLICYIVVLIGGMNHKKGEMGVIKDTSIPIRKQSILIAYIVKSIKNQKGKPSEMDLPLLKNDITRFFIDMMRAFIAYSTGLGLKIQKQNRNKFWASISQTRDGFTAVNLTLSTFPSTRTRSLLLGGGVNSSPGQQAIALSSSGVRV